jgi:GNAT superfamily N-acetyltransferase
LAVGVSNGDIHELAIPTGVGAEGWSDFEAATMLHFANEALVYGTTELGYTAAEMLPEYQDQEYEPKRLFVARDGELIISRGYYDTEPGDDPQTCWLYVDVRESHRHSGHGTAMLDWLHGIARTDGVRKAIAYCPSADGPGERIVAPTGYGSLPAGNSEVRMLLGNDYRLHQIERGSRLRLPVDAAELLEEATRASGADFGIHYWVDRTPERWRDDMAVLRQRMSTEEPKAGLDEPEDVWTVGRLVETEERLAAGPRTYVTTAIEHRPTGHLIGFTTISAPAELDRPAAQEDTLVLPEHRGHRLGMLLKVANLDHLQRVRPGHPAVITYNAEENRHMLGVNEAVGFLPIGYEGAWRRDLPH